MKQTYLIILGYDKVFSQSTESNQLVNLKHLALKPPTVAVFTLSNTSNYGEIIYIAKMIRPTKLVNGFFNSTSLTPNILVSTISLNMVQMPIELFLNWITGFLLITVGLNF